MPATWTTSQITSQLLRSGLSWSGSTITYSFPATAPSWSFYSGGEGPGFSALTTAQRDAAVLAIGLWDDLIAPDFVQVSSGGSITFQNTTSGIGYAHAYYPGTASGSGSVWFNPAYNSTSGTNDLVTPKIGAWGFLTYVHELGHALGLSHPGNYNGGSPTYGTDALYAQDSIMYTVMSYFDAINTGADWIASNGKEYFAQTPMLHDIMAIQARYGAETTTRTDNTTYGFNATTGGPIYDFTVNLHPILAIWDSAGVDTLDLSGFATSSRIDLNPGTYSDCDGMTFNIAIAYNCYIENAIGGNAADSITGNALGNLLVGNGGNDVIKGGDGNDTLNGGTGNDTLTGDAGVDVFLCGDGDDIVYADIFDDLFSSYGGIGYDILYVTGTLGYVFDYLAYGFEEFHEGLPSGPPPIEGTSAAETLNGTSSADTIYGYGGDDTLNGNDGDDVLIGGDGNDRLNGGNGIDTASYRTATVGVVVNLGNTRAQSTVGAGSDTLSGIENLEGSNLNDTLTGSSAANILIGLDGNDTLNGGAGADTLIGGIGNDTYVVDNVGDIVTELYDEGLDTVQAAIAYALGVNVENLTLTGTAAISGTGNSGDNVITGNGGNNILEGLGGADTLIGGNGADTASYASSAAGVTVSLMTGAASGGDATGDTFSSIENVTGSAGDDVIEGNTGNNILNGGLGIDTVSYENAAAAVRVSLASTGGQRTGGSGQDTILGFENLTGSAFNDTLTGSAGANTLSGLAGNDRLSGGAGNDRLIGGLGKDTLTGGLDSDTFVFDNITDSVVGTNRDLVTDFVIGVDKLDLSGLGDEVTGPADHLSFIGAGAFTGVAGELRQLASGSQTILEGDVNGDGIADFQIAFNGTLVFGSGDFIL